MRRFRIWTVTGESNPAADATSRYPSETVIPSSEALSAICLFTEPDGTDDDTLASKPAGTKGFGVITWDAVRDVTWRDPSRQLLLHYICSGFPTSRQSLPAEVQEYWQYRDCLSAVDEVLMMDDHILVPPELRQDALDALHTAHQGVSSMQNRAQASTFWPGLSSDLDTVRRECAICNQTAPSHSPAEPVTPSYPLQVIVDRFSGSQYTDIALPL